MGRKFVDKNAVLLIIVLALVLRLISLNQSLWLDEGTSAILARDNTLVSIIKDFAPGDFHPPLYYLLLNLWSRVFGHSEVALRGLSVLTGLGTIGLVYLIGEKLFNKKTGYIAALLLAISPLHIYYSQEARMYSLQTLFVAASFYFFVMLLKKEKPGYWIGFAISIALIGMTDYLPLLILPVFWLIGLLEKKDRLWWKKFVVSHLPLLFSLIIWYPIFARQLNLGLNVEQGAPIWWGVLGKTSLKEIFLVPTKFILGRISFYNKTFYAAVILGTGLVYAYFLYLSAKNWRKTKYIWVWFVVPFIIAAVIGLFVPVFSYFRLLFLIPAFVLLVAYGLVNSKKEIYYSGLIFILSVSLVSYLIYISNLRFQREDWRGLVNFIEENSKEKESIALFVANSQMEAFRYYKKNVRISGPEGLSDAYDQIWLMRYVQPMFDPEDRLRSNTESLGYKKTGEYDFNSVVVWRYEK